MVKSIENVDLLAGYNTLVTYHPNKFVRSLMALIPEAVTPTNLNTVLQEVGLALIVKQVEQRALLQLARDARNAERYNKNRSKPWDLETAFESAEIHVINMRSKPELAGVNWTPMLGALGHLKILLDNQRIEGLAAKWIVRIENGQAYLDRDQF